MSAWKSRWSCERLVKAPTAKRVPATRPSASAWLDTSIATSVTPSSQHHREQRLQVGGLGGGERAGQRARRRCGCRRCRPARWCARPRPARLEQVRDGGLAAGPGDAEHAAGAAWGRRRRCAAAVPSTARGLRVHQHGQRPRRGPRSRPGGVGEDGDGAAAERASPAKSAPCARAPGRAANRSPGRTSAARSVTPVTDRGRRVDRGDERAVDGGGEDVQVDASRGPGPRRPGGRGDGGGADGRHAGRLPAPMIAPDRRPTPPQAAPRRMRRARVPTRRAPATPDAAGDARSAWRRRRPGELAVGSRRRGRAAPGARSRRRSGGRRAAAAAGAATRVWTGCGSGLTGSFSRWARYEPMSWNSGAALVPPCGASSMIATTYRGSCAGSMPAKVIQYVDEA